jgi:hypothetical protein
VPLRTNHPIVAAAGAVLLALSSLTLGASPSGAAQGKTKLPTKTIVTKSDKDINAIRTFFFCQTAACKKGLKANSAAATAGLSDLRAEVMTMKADAVPSSEKKVVAKYVTDASALINAFQDYPKQADADDQANNIGIIYYQSSNLGSDSYLLGCISTKSPVSFKIWSVGVVGVAYAMQVDTQAETSTAPASTIVAANQSLLVEAASLLSDTNGPSAKFNKLVAQFAKTQALDSRDSLLILDGKSKSIKPATLKALAAKLSAEFKVIASLQNELATKS